MGFLSANPPDQNTECLWRPSINSLALGCIHIFEASKNLSRNLTVAGRNHMRNLPKQSNIPTKPALIQVAKRLIQSWFATDSGLILGPRDWFSQKLSSLGLGNQLIQTGELFPFIILKNGKQGWGWGGQRGRRGGRDGVLEFYLLLFSRILPPLLF